MSHPSIRPSFPTGHVEHSEDPILKEITLLSEKVGLREKIASLLGKKAYGPIRLLVRQSGEALAGEMNKQAISDKGPYSFDSILNMVPASDEQATRLMNLQRIFMLTKKLRATQT